MVSVSRCAAEDDKYFIYSLWLNWQHGHRDDDDRAHNLCQQLSDALNYSDTIVSPEKVRKEEREKRAIEVQIFAEFFVLTLLCWLACVQLLLSMLLHTPILCSISSSSRISWSAAGIDAAAAAAARARWIYTAIRWMRRRETMFTRSLRRSYACIRVSRFSFRLCLFFFLLLYVNLWSLEQDIFLLFPHHFLYFYFNRITRTEVHIFLLWLFPSAAEIFLPFFWLQKYEIKFIRHAISAQFTLQAQTRSHTYIDRHAHKQTTHADEVQTNAILFIIIFLWFFSSPLFISHFWFFFLFFSSLYVNTNFAFASRINKTNTDTPTIDAKFRCNKIWISIMMIFWCCCYYYYCEAPDFR